MKTQYTDLLENPAFMISAYNSLVVALKQIATYDPTKLDAATLGNIARNALVNTIQLHTHHNLTYEIRKRGALYSVFYVGGNIQQYASISRARCNDFIDAQKERE